MNRSQGMSIEELINSEYVEKAAILPEKLRPSDGDEFLVWKGGRVPVKARVCHLKQLIAKQFRILLSTQ